MRLRIEYSPPRPGRTWLPPEPLWPPPLGGKPMADSGSSASMVVAGIDHKQHQKRLKVLNGDSSAMACKGNSNGQTRLFVGNLPVVQNDGRMKRWFDVDSLKRLLPGITHIKNPRKGSGDFYGVVFLEMKSCELAAAAVAQNGHSFQGRSLTIRYAPARSGEKWPPPVHIWPIR